MNDAGLPGAPERSRLTAGALLFIAILGLAAGLTRFWALGARPLHHDESIHAYQSWTLSRGGDWRYDPAYHGPFLYYVNALVYKVFGATDFTARLMPAIFGLILIGFAWPLRRWVGKPAAAVYAVLVLTSAHFTYFSRFIREDLYSLVFTFATILAFQRFLETDRSKWLMLSAASFALAGVTKENAYMTGVLFVAYGLWCLVRGLGSPEGPRPRQAFADGIGWTIRHIVPILSAGILFLVIWATMYTAFGKYPGDWWAINKAVKYWMGQHAIARIPGPWYYYFPQLAYYDTAILLAACFAFSRREWRRDPLLRAVLILAPITLAAGFFKAFRPESAQVPAWVALAIALAAAFVALFVWKDPEPPQTPLFLRFVAFWAVGSLAIYGWAREKVPWLTVHPLLPLTILAALGVVRLWPERRRAWAAVVLAAGAVLLVINTSGMYLAAFRYGAHDKEKEPGHAEMLAYVQTSKDLVRALSAVETAKARVPAGQPVVTIVGESTWPLTWYLRDAVAQWASRIDQASTPVIVGDWDPEGALEKQLASRYDAKRVPIRAWWFPEPTKEGAVSRPSFRDGLRWWLFHEIWSPIGSQDATFFVRKDLGGTGMLEPLQLQVQDTSSKDYPSDGIELPPAKAFGPALPGGGQFAEPRGIASDGSGNIYVADSKNSRIAVLDPNGAFVRALGTKGPGEGQLNEPSGVTVGTDGLIYVADTWNHRVAIFQPDGRWRANWTDPEKAFFGPRSLVLSRGSLYVSDTGNKRVVRFDATTGTVTGRWGTAGSEPGQFVEPVGVAADSSGRIYVADTGNHRVQVFDGEGAFLRQFPVYGWKDFYTEPYLVIGPGDSVLITDSWKPRIALYDSSGAFQKAFKAELKRPTGITLDAYGHVLVTDREANRVLSWPLDALR